MSPIDRVREMMNGDVEIPSAWRILDMRLVDVEEGSATVEMPITDRLLNRGGGVHGGFLATLADASMGATIGTISDDDEIHSTIEIKLNFVKPASIGTGPLRATGHLLHRSRSIAHVEGEIVNGSGELVAKATSTWGIRKM